MVNQGFCFVQSNFLIKEKSPFEKLRRRLKATNLQFTICSETLLWLLWISRSFYRLGCRTSIMDFSNENGDIIPFAVDL